MIEDGRLRHREDVREGLEQAPDRADGPLLRRQHGQAAGQDRGGRVRRLRSALPSDLQADVEAVLEDWGATGKVARLWDGDASLWTGARRVALAGMAERGGRAARHTDELRALAEGARADGLRARAAAGHGRVEPGARGARRDLRRDRNGARRCTCWTRPTRPRCAPPRRRSTSRARCSSCRASPARRSSRTC